MKELRDLPNIGPELESQLIKAGIGTCRDLIQLGSREAFARIRLEDESSCLNKLYALEGAIQGVRWHYLSQEDKAKLKAFYQELVSVPGNIINNDNKRRNI